MSTITIPAREVKAGDVIDFGDRTLLVRRVESTEKVTIIFGRIVGVEFTGRVPDLDRITVPADLPITVRPDPDAELIEVMARAAYLDDGYSPTGWPSTPVSETYRGNIRAALSAAREAGLL